MVNTKHLSQIKHKVFKVIGVGTLIWWSFVIYTMASYVIVGCKGVSCSLENFTEQTLTVIFLVSFILAIPTGIIFYLKVISKRPFIEKIVFILSFVAMIYVLFLMPS